MAPGRDAEPVRSVRHLQPVELAGSELTYVLTTSGAAPPDVRSMLEVIVVDESDKTIVHRGVEHHIRTGIVGIRSAFEVGRLVRRHAPKTRVRILALADNELEAAFRLLEIKPQSIDPVLSYGEDRRLRAAAAAVFSAVESRAPAMAVQTRVATCALRVVRTLSGRDGAGTRRTDETSAQRIRDALHDRLSEDRSLDDLARDVGLSRTYVVHAFRRTFNLPPYEYLMHIRVAKARDMLAAGRRPIDVAHECGFCDQSHLNRWFRSVVGVTPGEYRQGVAPRRAMRRG